MRKFLKSYLDLGVLFREVVRIVGKVRDREKLAAQWVNDAFA